jgi:FkbM family methyltransferase
MRPTVLGDPWVDLEHGGRVFLDAGDARSVRVMQTRGHADAEALRVWERLVEIVRPDCVVDVGANYGEFLIGPDWPPGAVLIAAEANPLVAARLRRSLGTVRSRSVVVCAAIGSSRTVVGLDTDDVWSGCTVTAPAPRGASGAIAQLTFDDIVGLALDGERGRPRRLLAKVDVEGNEADVLRGFVTAAEEFEEAIFLVEIAHLARADRAWLRQRFEVLDVTTMGLKPHSGSWPPGSKDVVLAPRRGCLSVATADSDHGQRVDRDG